MPSRFREAGKGDADKGITLILKEFRFADDKLMISYYGEVGVGEDAKSA